MAFSLIFQAVCTAFFVLVLLVCMLEIKFNSIQFNSQVDGADAPDPGDGEPSDGEVPALAEDLADRRRQVLRRGEERLTKVAVPTLRRRLLRRSDTTIRI